MCIGSWKNVSPKPLEIGALGLERRKVWFGDMNEVRKGCCCSVGQVSVQAWVQISWKTPFYSLALNFMTQCISFSQELPQNWLPHIFFSGHVHIASFADLAFT